MLYNIQMNYILLILPAKVPVDGEKEKAGLTPFPDRVAETYFWLRESSAGLASVLPLGNSSKQ